MIRTESHRQRKLPIIISHTGETNLQQLSAIKKTEVSFGEGASDLPRAVGPKVEKDHAVAILNDRYWLFVLIDNYDRLHELIGDALTVRLANGGDRIAARAAFTEPHQPMSLLSALPSLIAVHRVVAPDDGCDFAHSVFAHPVDKLRGVTGSRIGRRVAPIQKSMYEDSFNVLVFRHPKQRVQMLLRRVHSSVRDQAE